VWNLVVLVLLLLTAPLVVVVFGLVEWLITNAQQSLRDTITAIVQNLTNVILATVDLIQSGFNALAEQIANFLQRFDLSIWLAFLLVLRRYALWLGLAVGVGLVLWIAGKQIWGNEDAPRPVEEERDSLLRMDDLLEKLKQAISGQAQKVAEGLKGLVRFQTDRRLWAAARIRRIYAKLMALCERLEAARPQAQTPNEYLPTLKMLFPMHYAEVELLTAAYVRVRYGELPEGEQELRGVEAAWKRVRAQGELVLKYNREQEKQHNA
jgi:hypothetical protein